MAMEMRRTAMVRDFAGLGEEEGEREMLVSCGRGRIGEERTVEGLGTEGRRCMGTFFGHGAGGEWLVDWVVRLG
jgi:hypothetical protein